jgi:hypothetical protein
MEWILALSIQDLLNLLLWHLVKAQNLAVLLHILEIAYILLYPVPVSLLAYLAFHPVVSVAAVAVILANQIKFLYQKRIRKNGFFFL